MRNYGKEGERERGREWKTIGGRGENGWWMDELSFPRVIFNPAIYGSTETAGVAAQTLGNLPTFAAS